MNINTIYKNRIKRRTFLYGLASISVFILNSAFTTNYGIMLTLTAIEVLILIKCFALGQDIHYLCYYILFLSSSMESSAFVGTLKILEY